MIKFYSVLTALLFFIELSACAQPIQTNKNGFAIDKSIQVEIDKKLGQFNKQANSNLAYKIYDDNKMIAQSADAGDPGLSFTMFLENCNLINCLNGIDEGLGFALILCEDTTLLKFKLASKIDENSLANGIQPEVEVECASYKITLSQKPNYTNGEMIEGKIELESKLYSGLVENEKKKLKCVLEVYFRSEPMPIIGGKYKTLEKKN